MQKDNTKNSALVIASYPPEGTLYGKGVGGLASFTKNTLTSMASMAEFTVLAEYDEQPSRYKEGKNTIERCWRRNSLSLYPKLLNHLLHKRNHIDHLIIEFEFSIYGGSFTTGFFPLIPFAARFLGYNTTIVLHQIVSDFSELAPHLGINPHSLQNIVTRYLLKMYYFFLTISANKIIVLDQIHKNKLQKMTEVSNIHVIAHGVDTHVNVPPNEEKIPIKERPLRLMSFGFLTWYKGSDWLAKTILKHNSETENTTDKYTLTLAGGESPTQKHTSQYQDYYSRLLELRDSSNFLEVTGFIPENEIANHFTNADIILFPYRILMSSSGPLSLAISYESPFLLSENLQPYTATQDFQEALASVELQPEDICFTMDEKDLFLKLLRFRSSPSYRSKLTNLTRYVKKTRSWSTLGPKYHDVIFKK